MPADNPATRLHQLLVDLAELPDANPASGPLALVLGVRSPIQPAAMHQAFADFARLPVAIKHAFSNYAEEDRELFLRHMPAVEDLMAKLAVSGTIPLSHLRQSATSEVIYGVEVAASILQRSHGYAKPFDSEVLEEVHQRLGDLLEEVLGASDLDADVREFLADQLTSLRRFVRRARVLGREAVEAGFDQVMGAVIRERDLSARASGHPVFLKIGKFLAGLALLLEVSSNALELPQAFRDAIADSETPETIVVVVDHDPAGPTPEAPPRPPADADPPRGHS